MVTDLNKEAAKFAKNFEEITGLRLSSNRKAHRYSSDKKEAVLDEEYEESQRLNRIEEIRVKANDDRVRRCEAKMAEVGGSDKFLDLLDSGGWNDAIEEEMTLVEQECAQLQREQMAYEAKVYERENPGQKYVDPQAKF